MTISQKMHVNPLIHTIFSKGTLFTETIMHLVYSPPPPPPPKITVVPKGIGDKSFFLFGGGGGGGGESGGQTRYIKVSVKMVNGNVRFYFGISLLRTLTSTTNWYRGM